MVPSLFANEFEWEQRFPRLHRLSLDGCWCSGLKGSTSATGKKRTVYRLNLSPVVICYRGLFVAAARLAGRLFPKGRLHAWYRVYEEPCGCAQGRAWPNNSALDHLKLFWRHNHTGYFKG
jgi:hypothetical protein